MEEDAKIEIPKFKVNPKKMPMLLAIIFIIFCALLYIVLNPTTEIKTLLYKDNCTEVYINGVLNGSMCPLNIYNKKTIDDSGFAFNINISNVSNARS